MKEQERHFFQPRNLPSVIKKSGKISKFCRHDFCAQCLSLLFGHFRLHRRNIARHVLLQNDRYIFKTFIFFSFNKYSMVISILIYTFQGFYLKSRLKTVRTRSGHLGWDATLK